ncbi:MAG: nicotinamide mononucleotide transporter [Bacteroidales bacterium]|nr:nicotinamide mononucleotide transporter [Bacteroidales bacterium]
MEITSWLSDKWIEIFGALAGIIYVFLEIRQNIWLWPVGIVTSAVYIWVFFTSKFYADMTLQGYYLVISFAGWYWWIKGAGKRGTERLRDGGTKGQREEGTQGLRDEETERRREEETKGLSDEGTEGLREEGTEGLKVTRLKLKTGLILGAIFVALYFFLWLILSRMTDSPVPQWDSFITSLSVIATWMLARKIYEHWFLWIVVNTASVILFINRGLYPTVLLYLVYGIMSIAGLLAWRKSLNAGSHISQDQGYSG